MSCISVLLVFYKMFLLNFSTRTKKELCLFTLSIEIVWQFNYSVGHCQKVFSPFCVDSQYSVCVYDNKYCFIYTESVRKDERITETLPGNMFRCPPSQTQNHLPSVPCRLPIYGLSCCSMTIKVSGRVIDIIPQPDFCQS